MAHAGLLVSTAILLHLGLARPAVGPASILLALIQAASALALAAGGPRRLAPLACCLVLPACLLLPHPGMVAAVLVSHTMLYAGLAVLFGRSLRRGREPLVTRMAAAMEPAMTEAMRVYTRRVTWLWTLYGPAQITASLLLLAFAPLHAWSVFVNLLDLPLLLALLGLEYVYRRWRLRGSTRASLRDTLHAAARQLAPP